MNIYEQFLEYVRNKTYSEDTILEYHHEPPHHTGDSSDTSALNVKSSVEDHILLHQYRWIVYGEKGDYLMFKGRQKDTQEFRKVMNQRRIEVTKQNKSGFWDPNLQSVLGKRGGQKGGLANTKAQLESRRKVGLSNRKNSDGSRNFIARSNYSKWMLWYHETTGFHLIPPQDSISTLRLVLTDLGDRSVKRTIADAVRGSVHKSYGWSLMFVYTAIPSEVIQA